MKPRTPLLALVTAGSMLLAGSLLAQDRPMPTPPPPPQPVQNTQAPTPPPTQPMPGQAQTPPPPTQTMPAQTPTPAPPPGGTQAQTNAGGQQVTINSSVPPINPGPAPSFEQLSGGSKVITESQASAYPLLANDFSYVDKGHTGHITKAQYEAWLSHNQ